MLTSGRLCGYQDFPRLHQTFLVQLLLLEDCIRNPDFDDTMPPHPVENPKYRLYVQEKGAQSVYEPLLVENIIFPEGRELPPTRANRAG